MFQKVSKIICATIVMFMGVTSASFAASPVYTGTFSNKAIQGYDVVSYFQGDGVPVKGLDEFQMKWQGADWYFASAENLELFKADPVKYAPQYGGYCAWAVAQGKLAKGDATVYTVLNEKLYLNYNNSINEKWTAQRAEFITKGDELFPNLVEDK